MLTFTNANLMQNRQTRNIDLDIKDKFDVIDHYLPKKYTHLVIAKLPGTTAEVIRWTKHNRSGNTQIIKALYEVAIENKL